MINVKNDLRATREEAAHWVSKYGSLVSVLHRHMDYAEVPKCRDAKKRVKVLCAERKSLMAEVERLRVLIDLYETNEGERG